MLETLKERAAHWWFLRQERKRERAWQRAQEERRIALWF